MEIELLKTDGTSFWPDKAFAQQQEPGDQLTLLKPDDFSDWWTFYVAFTDEDYFSARWRETFLNLLRKIHSFATGELLITQTLLTELLYIQENKTTSFWQSRTRASVQESGYTMALYRRMRLQMYMELLISTVSCTGPESKYRKVQTSVHRKMISTKILYKGFTVQISEWVQYKTDVQEMGTVWGCGTLGKLSVHGSRYSTGQSFCTPLTELAVQLFLVPYKHIVHIVHIRFCIRRRFYAERLLRWASADFSETGRLLRQWKSFLLLNWIRRSFVRCSAFKYRIFSRYTFWQPFANVAFMTIYFCVLLTP